MRRRSAQQDGRPIICADKLKKQMSIDKRMADDGIPPKYSTAEDKVSPEKLDNYQIPSELKGDEVRIQRKKRVGEQIWLIIKTFLD